MMSSDEELGSEEATPRAAPLFMAAQAVSDDLSDEEPQPQPEPQLPRASAEGADAAADAAPSRAIDAGRLSPPPLACRSSDPSLGPLRVLSDGDTMWMRAEWDQLLTSGGGEVSL